MKMWLHFASMPQRGQQEKMVLLEQGSCKEAAGTRPYLLTHDFVELRLQQKRKTAGP